MKKKIVLILGVLLITACSQNKVEPKAKNVKVPTKVPTKIPIKEAIAPIVQEESSEFIPEHIKRSSIEVVKHY